MDLIVETDLGHDPDDFFTVCYIAAVGVRIRAVAASPCLSGLKELHLRENSIGDAGLQALAESEHLGGLSLLNIWGNGADRRRRGTRALLARFGDRLHV